MPFTGVESEQTILSSIAALTDLYTIIQPDGMFGFSSIVTKETNIFLCTIFVSIQVENWIYFHVLFYDVVISWLRIRC